MYPQRQYIENDFARLLTHIEKSPLASLIYQNAQGDIELCHIPLVLDENKQHLLGHMAANNPLAKLLAKQPLNIKCLFNGADCYVSPNDAEKVYLPTWHYAKLEVKGMAQPITKPSQKREIMAYSVTQFEDKLATQWQLSQVDEHEISQSLKYIMVFKIEITEILGNFKLSQDKASETREEIKQSLYARGDKDSAELIY
ncbi:MULTISPECIES: FMN-binding negative transcriptional regulator [Pseudoalteromonas]|uniref:FMN-binding negative transcriptional regulator n=1 Tax=Pseudoalteromonas TaxID=53246 RepID=UPI00026C99C2|nr:FMN-binding negative transcriptional regulator [Pseudoalteromonas spongiae]ATC99869.1 transcriptional regulator [Pseudoalteromonas spongiae UST010723-006]